MNINKLKTGRLIAERRKALNMTQSELAEKLHISAKAVSKWERAQNFPGVDMLKNLAEVLQVQVNDIMDGEIVSTISMAQANNDWNSLYLKNGQYMNYLRAMDLNDLNEDLIVTCILNDYYFSHKSEMDNIYNEKSSFINAYERLFTYNNPDLYLSLQNSFQAAKATISKELADNESIDEANMNVSYIELDMIFLMYQKGYSVHKFDLKQRKLYDDLLRYMLLRCDMKDYCKIFNVADNIRAYKRVLTEIHSNHYELIDKYFEDDFVIHNGKYVFVEDFDKSDIISKFKGTIKSVEYEIYKALNEKKFNEKGIISALDEMGLYAAMLTKYDELGK